MIIKKTTPIVISYFKIIKNENEIFPAYLKNKIKLI